MNLGDAFDVTHLHATEMHFDVQVFDIVAVSPRTVEFKELTIALLTPVALSNSTISGVSY
jgi:hypothetical protein